MKVAADHTRLRGGLCLPILLCAGSPIAQFAKLDQAPPHPALACARSA